MAAASFSSCEPLVRSADFDRYLAALFAPSAIRPHLFALYAFNYEVAKTAETVSQLTLGLIRLQWWREAIEGIYAGRVRDHETVQAIATAIAAHVLPRSLFDDLIDARENDLEEAPFADVAALEAYADATSGNVMRLALRILGAGDPFDGCARNAGIAYALAGLLRALPHHAAQKRLMLPLGELQAAGLSKEDLFSGRMNANMSMLIAGIANRAETHLRTLPSARLPRVVLPALLPAALTRLYLKRMTGHGFDPFRDETDAPIYRRQLAMLSAVARRRI